MSAEDQPMPRTEEDWHDYVAKELREGDKRMDQFSADLAALKNEVTDTRTLLAENSASTSRIEGHTADMLAVFESWRGAMRALEMIGRLAKPLGYVATLLAGIAAAWAAVKSGGR